MAKTSLQNEGSSVTTGSADCDVIIIVDNQERPDAEEMKYDLQLICQEKSKDVHFKIMDTRELGSSDMGLLSLQKAVEGGKVVLPIFTERFMSDRVCVNALYTTIISQMKQKGNANFFRPVFFVNPRKARFTPVQFCNFRSFWWDRERDRETLVKILCS